MPNPKQLPHLIKLLEDDSPTVRNSVLKELASFGSSLEVELARQTIVLTPDQKEVVQQLLEDQRRTWLRKNWSRWFTFEHDKQRLEAALSLLAQFLNGFKHRLSVKNLLDRLAKEYIATHKRHNARTLANFLFKEQRLRGTVPDDYFNPQNSNLIYVIENKRGIPISLASVYILVGYRLGLKIEGCNFPGHFLAIVYTGEKKIIVDCFSGGRFIDEETLANLDTPVQVKLEHLTNLECSADEIITRMLRNLINAYQLKKDEANLQLMKELLEMIPNVS
ncbi:MAG: hypothetical protein HY707_05465 [Ignavibacteriae bacterium]|nr:hypothetical protein [Ignavibacteriota bacterium]